LATGERIKTFDLPATAHVFTTLQWKKDNRAVFFIDTRGDVSNIWSQPLEGNAKQETDFRTEQIFAFEWSRDESQLLLSRGKVTNDVVLISTRK
jgi:hypothetical protein